MEGGVAKQKKREAHCSKGGGNVNDGEGRGREKIKKRILDFANSYIFFLIKVIYFDWINCPIL